MYRLTSIKGNSQRLDGGAMFGNVPKALWSQWMVPDDQNRILLACRALLIQEENKNVLLETGIGAFFEPALQQRYGIEESEHVLLNSLQKTGLKEEDIDIVILSHLHFDHAGGLLSAWQANTECRLLFPKAKYLVSNIAWERACHPHVRDRISFIPPLNKLLEKSGRLIIVDNEKCDILGDHYRFMFTNGHTPGLMHTVFNQPGHDSSVIFASDLIPGIAWVHLPVSMGYDRAPELLIDEKKEMLELAIKQNGRLFYTHDPNIAMSRITQNEKGKFIPTEMVEELRGLCS
ncbi:MAG TPA: MBL fold metallo-hydrolase [Gammaproteobacteria bacterium]|nr:MBL fold metallo-hydrolase [Gammaproteobacteria bacterium]